jgi:hypothetical protein
MNKFLLGNIAIEALFLYLKNKNTCNYLLLCVSMLGFDEYIFRLARITIYMRSSFAKIDRSSKFTHESIRAIAVHLTLSSY